jgi:endonuclease VIII
LPEGDTILRAARTLQKAIGGQTISRFESTVPLVRRAAKSLIGQKVVEVTAAGKNLLMHFEDGRVLRSHMRMTGSWHIYRPGERWRVTEGAARVVIEAGEWVAVCFSAPVIELVTSIETHAPIATLGPDILGEQFDAAEAIKRISATKDRELGDAILDQTLVAGIGNVYKSEVLFICATHPRAHAGEVGDEKLQEILAEARKQMRANLTTNGRRTRGLGQGERFWVYRRSGSPCLRCGTLIKMIRQGELVRSTYYCPSCQGGE